ncbi:hypothetical protein CCAX7_58430 [Capsulimonas corticalis]|uniref:Uncharacterized protein n=1 Tax=Capsulimonas corticalis TaxID=2219043 RepID=A0A402D046_9BACT|nr:zinc ribbon domain-containing protein [Capsulimonas corticalis]BDI33792.1 hypothetical protein CCAX7_58430 [Capsulimonas corticalis]
MPPFAIKLLRAFSALLLWAGAALVIGGALSPWAALKVLRSVDVSVPGALFAQGGLCLAAGVLVLLGLRRSPLLCLIAALYTLGWVNAAKVEVPRRVKHQVIGTQLALFPLNRLLDQFHINDVEIADWSRPNAELLAPGLDWTNKGALLLLLGGLIGLPADPIALFAYKWTARARCRHCNATWLRSRQADFCPQCGQSTAPADRWHCDVCHGELGRSDKFCTHCGAGVGN